MRTAIAPINFRGDKPRKTSPKKQVLTTDLRPSQPEFTSQPLKFSLKKMLETIVLALPVSGSGCKTANPEDVIDAGLILDAGVDDIGNTEPQIILNNPKQTSRNFYYMYSQLGADISIINPTEFVDAGVKELDAGIDTVVKTNPLLSTPEMVLYFRESSYISGGKNFVYKKQV